MDLVKDGEVKPVEKKSTTTTIIAAACFAAGVGVGHITDAPDAVKYAPEVKRELRVDRVVPARVDTLYSDVVEGDSVGGREVSGTVDIPETIDRGRVVTRLDRALNTGDKVTVLTMLNDTVHAEDIREITEPPANGRELVLYNRLVIWERGIPTEVVDNEIQ